MLKANNNIRTRASGTCSEAPDCPVMGGGKYPIKLYQIIQQGNYYYTLSSQGRKFEIQAQLPDLYTGCC